jgi:hypothetical protein
MQSRRSLLFAAALLLAGLPVYGKSGGVLKGMVVNPNGSPAASAVVFCQTADGKAPHVIRSNANGEFQFANLPEGLYNLRAQGSAKWSEWEHNIVIRSGKETSVVLRLFRAAPPAAADPAKSK